MLPIRCFTCNNKIGHMWEPYMLQRQTHTGKECLDALGLRRVCCRRMLLTHVAVVDDIISFAGLDQAVDECGTMMLCEAKEERDVPCT